MLLRALDARILGGLCVFVSWYKIEREKEQDRMQETWRNHLGLSWCEETGGLDNREELSRPFPLYIRTHPALTMLDG